MTKSIKENEEKIIMFTYKIDDLSYLSLFEIQDADKLYDLINRNREHIGKWLKFPSMTLKAEDSQAFIERTRISYAKEEGYWLGKEYEGRGLITKSIKVLINHAFDKYKLNKIEIGAATENRRSREFLRN